MYRTADGIVYHSSFFSIIAALQGTDLLDPVDVACTADFVMDALDRRVKEELEGTGDLSREYAHLRLRGAVRELEVTDRKARHHKAPSEFLAIIADALWEARKALVVAEKYHASKQPKPREPQDWFKKADPAEDDSPLYTPVTINDLLDAVNGVGAASGVGTVNGGE